MLLYVSGWQRGIELGYEKKLKRTSGKQRRSCPHQEAGSSGVGGVVEGKAPVSMLKRDKEQSGETGMRGPWEP